MSVYKVRKQFTWGKLNIEAGQTLLIEDLGPNEFGNETSNVTVQSSPEQTQLVSTKAVQSMVELQCIEIT